jgi:hypothetical protein
MPAYWAVARVQPQREAFAVGHLEAAGFETFLPKVETKRTVGPLFRGYAFVLVVEQWRAIETTFGVLALVRFGDAAARCPDRKIEALRSRMNATGVIRLPPPPSKAPRLIIRKGARVRVTSRAVLRPRRDLCRHDDTPARVGSVELPRRNQAGQDRLGIDRAAVRSSYALHFLPE